MTDDLPTFHTSGSIARRFNVPLHRVVHFLRSRGVRPIARVGQLRVFAESDADMVGRELLPKPVTA